MQYSITAFIYQKVIISLISAFITGIVVGIIWGMHMLLSFLAGYGTGCIYFLLISYSTSSIFKRRLKKVRGFHLLGFAARYFLIAVILAYLTKYTDINIFALIAGLLVINIALVIGAFIKK